MSDTPQKTLRFAAPVYPGGRHCLICGNVTVGAVVKTMRDSADYAFPRSRGQTTR